VSANQLSTALKPVSVAATRSQQVPSAAHVPMVLDTLKFVDGALVFGLAWLAFQIDSYLGSPIPNRFWPDYGLVAITGTFIASKVFGLAGLYGAITLTRSGRQLVQLMVALICIAAVLALLAIATETWTSFSPQWLPLWLGLSFVSIAIVRTAVATAVRHSLAQGHLIQNVVIVGAGEYGQRLAAHLAASSDPSLRVIGFFDDRRDRVPRHVEGYPVLGTTDDLLELGKTTAIDHIIIALPWSAEARLLGILHKLKSLPTNISLCPDKIGFHLRCYGLTQCGTVPLVGVVDPPLRHWRGFAKACEDRMLAIFALIVTAPLFLIIALAIKLESPGPVLFRQKRYGFNNQEIEVYKFRTMYHELSDESGANQTRRNDPRVTRVGAFLRRTSLDELPQFLNVLKGDMSVVGPRPHPIGMRTEKRLCHEIVAEYAHRHRMKPGITGWAQVNGWRGATDTAEKLQRRVEHDLYYIENWSISFDLRILFLTVIRLFSDENAY